MWSMRLNMGRQYKKSPAVAGLLLTANRDTSGRRLDLDVVLDRLHAVDAARYLLHALHLVLRVDEAAELHHPAVGVDVDRGRAAQARVGRDRGLHLRVQGCVAAELARGTLRRVARRRACG